MKKWILPLVAVLVAFGLSIFFVEIKKKFSATSPEKLINFQSGEVLRLGDFSFTNQDGQLVTRKSVSGKIILASFFFSRCTSICPKLMASIQTLAEALKNEKDAVVLSMSVDPTYDQGEHLKKYADSLKKPDVQWQFLTGKVEDLFLLSKNTFGLAAAKTPEGDFIHSEKIVLIDDLGELRGYYDSTRKSEMKQLLRDTRLLVQEASARKTSPKMVRQ
jgi:protein SCO1/2